MQKDNEFNWYAMRCAHGNVLCRNGNAIFLYPGRDRNIPSLLSSFYCRACIKYDIYCGVFVPPYMYIMTKSLDEIRQNIIKLKWISTDMFVRFLKYFMFWIADMQFTENTPLAAFNEETRYVSNGRKCFFAIKFHSNVFRLTSKLCTRDECDRAYVLSSCYILRTAIVIMKNPLQPFVSFKVFEHFVPAN